LKLPETITGDTYTVSFKVNYNAVTACTATVGLFASTEAPANWISLGYGWNASVIPGIWSRTDVPDKWTDIFSDTELEKGKEYTFTYAVDNLAATVYVDGAKVAEGTVQSVSGANIYVGVNAWDTPANCTIDDLVIVNGVATSDVSNYTIGDGETTEDDTTVYVQYKKVSDNNYTVRVVGEVALEGTFSDSANTFYKGAGFRCAKTVANMGTAKAESYVSTVVFKSLVANGATVKAADGKYFIVTEITNVPADATFYVNPVCQLSEEGKTVSFTEKNYTINMADIIK
ncbi:MAG: LamG-like jellyroll fold domain-containing protein, partial [Lachnospiraceae bacterium]|nr:LamG-like jellyroll fold domain-containing protein [Lachnospiraceae bacterium]